MADLYLSIARQPDAVLDAVADAMDKRAAEPAMQAICAAYMRDLPGPGATVLEVGCGNGATTGLILENLAPGQLICIDPSPGLLDRARERYRDRANMAFALGDVLNTGQQDAAFDLVVIHTVFSHIPDHAGALAEAFRVLKPGGCLAVFDGDYATNTVALFDGDPLQAIMSTVQRTMIHDPYVMRRLPGLMTAAGFAPPASRAFGYTQTTSPDYLLSLIARGADNARRAGEIGPDLAEGFRREAERRVAEGIFYGAILFVSVTATRPPAV